jgi:hypothetical protein
MAEKKKTGKQKDKIASSNELIPERYHSVVYILLIVFAFLLFFNEALLKGKVFVSGDVIAYKSWTALIEDAKVQGVPLLWNPYIFCGMPAYASLTVGPERPFDLLGVTRDFILNLIFKIIPNRDVFEYVVYLILMSIGAYILSRRKGMEKFISFVVAFSMSFSTFFIVWVTVGHFTKIVTMSILPYVLLLIDELMQRFKLIYFVLLIIALWFISAASHIQMMFYVYLAVALYYLVYFIHKIYHKENLIGLIRSGLLFTVATFLVFGIFLDKYLPVWEYSHYSIRGQPPLIEKVTAQSNENQKQKTSGLDYDYATQWSFSPGEILTFFVPSIYGFGWRNYNGVLTGGETVRINTYFGPMPFTDAPNYLGAVVLLLAIIGIFLNFKENVFVKFLTLLIILSLFISFGKEFSLVYDIFFNYVPYFNRFRVPSMILSLVMFAVPLLAGFGLSSIVRSYRTGASEKIKNTFRNLAIASGLLFVITIIFPGFVSEIYRSIFADNQAIALVVRNNFGFVNQEIFNRVYPHIYQFIFDNFLKDLRIFLLLALVLFGAIYLYHSKILKQNIFNLAIALLVIFDLWRIDSLTLHYSDKEEIQSILNPPDYVQYIKQDTSLYRVLELSSGQPVMSNHLAIYRLQNVYGYQGAKMRAYQDLIEIAGITNPFVLNILNAKYVITDNVDSTFGNLVFNGTKKVLFNKSYLPRAFFVNRYEVAQPIQILNKMKNAEFNPIDVLFLEDTLKVKIDPPTQDAFVKILEYQIQKVKLKAKATGNNLLFMSDTWYPKWKCFIDGKEVPILKANYVFRAVVVPEGEHEILFVYKDDKFELGSRVSLGINILVLILLIVSIAPDVKIMIEKSKNSK